MYVYTIIIPGFFCPCVDFVAIEVDIEDEENERPVPTQRSNDDWLMLQLAIWWLVFIVVVLVVRSRPVVDCLQWIRRKLMRTKFEKTE